MPYFITNKSAKCSGWATVKADGEVMGCHTSKQAAVNHMVAISLAEKIPPGGELGKRNASGEKIIICDIDGTLINAGRLVQKTYDYVRSLEGKLFIVTGRPDSERSKTANQLHSLGIRYSRLIMNPDSTASSSAYKKATAERLLKTYNVVAAIENNATALSNYRELGIHAVNPATIKEPASKRDTESIGSVDVDNLKDEGMSESSIRADVASVAVGDWVSWTPALDDETEYGRIEEIQGVNAVVRIFDEESDVWMMSDETAFVLIADLMKIDPLTPIANAEVEKPMTSRSKWLAASWAIKARIEGLSNEARSIGGYEIRTNPSQFEVRQSSGSMTISGYAAVFNSDSHPLPFIERVMPGAFKRSLQSRNEIKLLWNHDTGEPLASLRGNSLRLWEDAKGLAYEATLVNTTRGRDVAELIRSGVIDAMSFGFNVIKDSWDEAGNRLLESVRLHEISVVSYPAYPDTAGTVSVRSAGINAETLADALLKLESGEELDPEHANIITDVVSKLQKTPEVEAVSGNILDLKQKQLELLMKKV